MALTGRCDECGMGGWVVTGRMAVMFPVLRLRGRLQRGPARIAELAAAANILCCSFSGTVDDNFNWI